MFGTAPEHNQRRLPQRRAGKKCIAVTRSLRYDVFVADVFSKRKRSQVMATIRGTGNKDTERRLASLLRKHGIKGWRRRANVAGKPDFVFQKKRIAVFVDGCFWHGCPTHGHQPKSNRRYWQAKLARNRRRDRQINRSLRTSGWRVLRIWAHELNQPKRVLSRVKRALLNPTRLSP